MTPAQFNAYNERRMAIVLDLLTEAMQAPTVREGDALVARAANVLAGVVRRQAKVALLTQGPRLGPQARHGTPTLAYGIGA